MKLRKLRKDVLRPLLQDRRWGGSYSNHATGQEAEPKWFYLRVMTF